MEFDNEFTVKHRYKKLVKTGQTDEETHSENCSWNHFWTLWFSLSVFQSSFSHGFSFEFTSIYYIHTFLLMSWNIISCFSIVSVLVFFFLCTKLQEDYSNSEFTPSQAQFKCPFYLLLKSPIYWFIRRRVCHMINDGIPFSPRKSC